MIFHLITPTKKCVISCSIPRSPLNERPFIKEDSEKCIYLLIKYWRHFGSLYNTLKRLMFDQDLINNHSI